MIVESVYIEITNRCNLNCRDCYNASGKNHETVELDPEILIRFIEALRDRFGVSSIHISGGEFLLHSQIEALLESMSELSADPETGMDFNFVTNGTIDDPLFYALLEENPKFHVQISLDGHNDPVNASMRGPGNFEKVMRTVENKRFYNQPVYKMVINRTNMHYIQEYFYLIQEELGGKPIFSFASRQGNAMEHWEELSLTIREKSDIILAIHKLYKARGMTDLPPLPTAHCDLTEGNDKIDICVKADGSIQPCQNLYDSRFTLANLYTLNWDALAIRIHSIHDTLIPRLSLDYGCRVCAIRPLCGKGCPANALLLSGDLLKSDCECELRRLGLFRILNHQKC